MASRRLRSALWLWPIIDGERPNRVAIALRSGRLARAAAGPCEALRVYLDEGHR